MRMQKTHHNNPTTYLLASLITLALGAAVLGVGVYIIDKAESASIIKYESTIVKKDKK